jgi:hypothetical protein
MRSGFQSFSSGPDQRILQSVKSSLRTGWLWAWGLLAVFLGLCGLAALEPEASEAVHSTIGLGGIGCVLWGIWQLMQYDS